VYAYGILGLRSGVVFALVIPWLELAFGVALLVGLFVGGAFVGSSLLLAVFTAAQSVAVVKGLSISCGCQLLGTGDLQVGLFTLLRSIGFLAIALAGVGLHVRSVVRLGGPRASRPTSRGRDDGPA
jgi:hypothetical protein